MPLVSPSRQRTPIHEVMALATPGSEPAVSDETAGSDSALTAPQPAPSMYPANTFAAGSGEEQQAPLTPAEIGHTSTSSPLQLKIIANVVRSDRPLTPAETALLI